MREKFSSRSDFKVFGRQHNQVQTTNKLTDSLKQRNFKMPKWRLVPYELTNHTRSSGNMWGVTESSRTKSKNKCWLNSLHFGRHLLQNSLFQSIQWSYRFFYSSKALWKSFFSTQSSTICDSISMSNTVPKCHAFSFTSNLENKAKS
jgi:hypothetical protein